jgi:hypothetical protein
MKTRKIIAFLSAIAFLLLLRSGALFAVESGFAPPVPAIPACAHLSVGSGYGLNYGGIGLGFEFNPRLPAKFGTGLYKYVSFGIGFGYLPDGGMAYSFAVRLYPLGRELFLQPRLSILYGVVAVAKSYYAGDERRSEGVGFGAGFLVRLSGQVFLDADAHLIVPVDYASNEIEGGRMRFSAGLRYRL